MTKNHLFSILFLLFSLNCLFAQEYFWDFPEFFSRGNSSFPQIDSNGDQIWVAWQEVIPSSGGVNRSYISLGTFENGRWQRFPRLMEFLQEANQDTPFFTLGVDNQGQAHLAVLGSTGGVELFYFNKDLQELQSLQSWNPQGTVLGPKLKFPQGRDPILLATLAFEELGAETQVAEVFYSIGVLRQRNGQWDQEFELLSDRETQPLALLPSYASTSEGEHIAYQVFTLPQEGEVLSLQIFLASRFNQENSWSSGTLLTGFNESLDLGVTDYDNQRPWLTALPSGALGMSWERNIKGNSPAVYYASFNPRNPTLIWERVTTQGVRSGDSRVFVFQNEVYITWFSSQNNQNQVFLGKKRGILWDIDRISTQEGEGLYPRPGVLNDRLFIFWENRREEDRNIMVLGPDEQADPPELRPVDFSPGAKTSQEEVQVAISFPPDSSGISGYSYVVTQNPAEQAPLTLMASIAQRSLRFLMPEDGLWYLKVRVRDRGGNWSDERVITVVRDRTAPPPPRIFPLDYDDFGFPLSNTIRINWEARDGETQGYQYRLSYLGPLGPWNWEEINVPALPSSIRTTEEERQWNNLDNGRWALSLSSFDEVGNQSLPTTYYFELNKYRPVTIISNVTSVEDEFGLVSLRIQGRGFSSQGRISQIILDREGREPYDGIWELEASQFTVLSDNLITGPTLDNLEEGIYRLGLVHPLRGLQFTGPILKVDAFGTVKFGDFRFLNRNFWDYLPLRDELWTTNGMLYWAMMILMALSVLFASGKAYNYVAEGQQIKLEVKRLLAGEALEAKIKEKVKVMIKKGIGLRIKFAISILLITTMVILMVAVTLGIIFTNTSKENLGLGLEEKAEVLLDSLVKAGETYLPNAENEFAQLVALQSQVAAMEEAGYVVIVGRDSARESENFNYIWSQSDPNIMSRISPPGEVIFGLSEYNDELSPQIQNLAQEINSQAPSLLGDKAQRIQELSRELSALRGRFDSQSEARAQELGREQDDLRREISELLIPLGNRLLTYPEFIPQNLSQENMEYIFFKPVLYYRPGDEGNLYRGGVRISVSVEKILEKIASEQRLLIQITGLIALIALGLGLAGALILSALTLGPIKLLVSGVEKIRDTEDKSQLKDHYIKVDTGDELAQLASTINDMTKGLVKAAEANKELIVGKEVQKMFIPLDKDSGGRKKTTGEENTERAEFFGYYEGAKGVSGDYFDYSRIDKDHFAIIKCDVAGKGVPAALIMVEVATIFLNYFKDWPNHKSMDLTPVINRMNDLLEERGFKGRFAALVMIILNEKTGKCSVMNAGDKLLHMYKASAQKMITLELPETPAAGVFPTMLVEMQNGFRQIELTLEKGDTLWLFTDGIEESKSFFRNTQHQRIFFRDPEDPTSLVSEADGGIGDEELGLDRIDQILNAVYQKGSYVLERKYCATPGEKRIFDFSKMEGTVKEAVTALVSVEKMFRMHSPGAAGAEEKLQMDVSIEDFLKKHLVNYQSYFPRPSVKGELEEYVYQLGHREDDQYDDLTVLAIKKK